MTKYLNNFVSVGDDIIWTCLTNLLDLFYSMGVKYGVLLMHQSLKDFTYDFVNEF